MNNINKIIIRCILNIELTKIAWKVRGEKIGERDYKNTKFIYSMLEVQ